MNCSEARGPQTLSHGSELGETNDGTRSLRPVSSLILLLYQIQVPFSVPFVLCGLSLFIHRWALIPEVKASSFVSLIWLGADDVQSHIFLAVIV